MPAPKPAGFFLNHGPAWCYEAEGRATARGEDHSAEEISFVGMEEDTRRGLDIGSGVRQFPSAKARDIAGDLGHTAAKPSRWRLRPTIAMYARHGGKRDVNR
jgi:hypothetical protein